MFASVLAVCQGVAVAADWIYTVRPGDNLWDLSEEYLVSMRYWRPLQRLNEVQDPKHMPPGMRLRFPIEWLRIQPVPVRVVSVTGAATVRESEGAAETVLQAGVSLPAGASVVTGPEAVVILEFADQSRLILKQNSSVRFDSLSAYGRTGMVDTRLRLQQGRTDVEVKPARGPASRYEITTPAALSAVRGTGFRISAAADEPVSRTEVLEGRVAVSGAGVTRVVRADFGTLAKAGEAPLKPRALLPAPDLEALEAVVDRVPVQFRWPGLAGAGEYRVQIAAGGDFDTPLFDRTTARPQVTGPDLPDGEYSVRVRGIDELGLEGIDAERRFTVDARPEPPILVEPSPEATIRSEVPEFVWSEPEGVASYRFQLASADDFSSPLVDEAGLSDNAFVPAELAPGNYYWRVATRDRSGEQGPFGDPQPFTLRPTPASPELEAPSVGDDEIVFRWREGLPGQRYHFQLARDRAFEELMADAMVAEPRYAVPRLEAGSYYLRVAVIDVDGYVGPFGNAQRLDVPIKNYWPPTLVLLLGLVLAL